MRMEDVRVEEVRGRAEELVHVPGDDVHALQRVAHVFDGVARAQRLRQEAQEDEDEVKGDRGGGGARAPGHHGREHYGGGARASTRGSNSARLASLLQVPTAAPSTSHYQPPVSINV